ncbi:hypothetical protein [uncultured Clostridium sp.]|uniref:hypothetical protein n=1 Tax=uncultured Clostridium sp. TaxID=59620 RepID=UPI002616E4F0|nr:hypothetical protein [uncultured Clostridium sp.]
MKIKTEVLVTKVELKQKKDGGAYLLVDMLDMKSGDLFNILHKNVEDMGKFPAMQKVDVTLNLTSSKYGLSLAIEKVGDGKGEI